MAHFDRLYDQAETAKVRFIGFISESARYDFGLVYTQQFYGKPLVICMQTGKSTLLCSDDVKNIDQLMKTFQISNREDAEQLSLFLEKYLPSVAQDAQYW